MKPKTILFIIGLLVLVLGALPLASKYLPAAIPTSGVIYQAVLIVLGLIGMVASMSNKVY